MTQAIHSPIKSGRFNRGIEFKPYIQEVNSNTYHSEFSKAHRSRLDKMNLEEGVKIKAQYHQERYKEAIMPKPLIIEKAKVTINIEEALGVDRHETKLSDPSNDYTRSFRR